MSGMRGLVFISLCLSFQKCRGVPSQLPDLSSEPPGHFSLSDPLMDYDRLDEELGGGGGRVGPESCGSCEPELCPETRGCRAGLVLDSCGCCMECGNLEGQACDPGNHSVFYGLCGVGMRCQADPRPGGREGEEEDEEEVCVCEEQEAVCGSDGVSYMNMCQYREAAFSKPGLKIKGKGPCKTGMKPENTFFIVSACLSFSLLSHQKYSDGSKLNKNATQSSVLNEAHMAPHIPIKTSHESTQIWSKLSYNSHYIIYRVIYLTCTN